MNIYVLGLYIENKVPLGFQWHFHDNLCMDFVNKALFKCSGNIS